MKYRRLRLDELEVVEDAFIQFLAINGIDVSIWQTLKNEPTKTESIIEAFSDSWFEMHLRKIRYIDMILEDEIMCFQCNIQNIVLVGLKFNDANSRDLNFNERLKKAIQTETCETYSTSKKYAKTREIELFDMLEKGAVVSDGTWFKALK